MKIYHRLRFANYWLWGKRYKFLLRYLYRKYRPTYYTVVEHPKCGRTWLRYMINQAEAKKYCIPLRNTMHDILYIRKDLPRVYYVHGFKPNLSLKEYNYIDSFRRGLTPKGIIFLVRSPLKMLVSYYYQILYRKSTINQDIGDFAWFIRSHHFGIKKYIEYLTFYMERLSNKNFILIRYEDLRNNTLKEFSRILNFIEVHLREDQLKEIIYNSTFEKMRALESSKKYDLSWIKPANSENPNSFKTRSMGKEDHLKHYTQEDIDYIKGTCKNTIIEKLYPNGF